MVRVVRAVIAVVASLSVLGAAVPAVLAHQEQEIGPYAVEVGFIDEPVYVGQRSGLEVFVHKGDQPVSGLEKTLKAQVIYGPAALDLALSPDESDPGRYEAIFIPTAAGQYTFHLTGSIEGTPVDERFTSGPTTFGDVNDVAAGQFPVQLPSLVDLAAQAKEGHDAASQLPIAIGLGGVGALLGLFALGVALAGRRRSVS